MDKKQLLDLYEAKGALLKGHFLLSSGRHSDQYLQSALILQYPDIAEKLGKALAEKFKGTEIDVVVGPAMGGIIVAHETARALGVRALFTERVDGMVSLRRGFSLREGERALICEDVVTTGKSVKEVIALLESLKVEIAGVGFLVDRSNGETSFGYQAQALLTLDVTSYDPDDCPLCRRGIPYIKPGSRKEVR
ncbi:MAG TPA: orotate phosphoribosyltransferase [Candidatus Mcinerneyibacteriales bacterium]|nr:orotate phosphoribosyltransferase [Candidatus Mcinerneyibacteriales bacterium]HPE20865.1 orotate phosphoribosyltransferase [Candidatus Mcinerneyibacteriales bacterium]HPJ70420.1 orotate phosphoribosyltransferase [Candidatus Mcinerneyibacteriales bacterium]